ncbi:unnamed protein product [Arabidopsis thaliana]|uniref:(thale cress) hypothetical protein n=1 Tax=Arabidopsis thaliana TaxID=3702 RepID=A0A7G2E3Y6_ARATH|nr:unnamed protein product [Arabidopsis thaliana]
MCRLGDCPITKFNGESSGCSGGSTGGLRFHLTLLQCLSLSSRCYDLIGVYEAVVMELKWVSCRKQSLFLISCLALLCLASLDTISCESTQNATDFKKRSQTVSCPPDWIIGPNQTKCYAYFKNSTSWEKSEMFCRTYGGHLASLASSKELSFVQKLCNGNVSSCWIGGRSMNSSTSGFRWSWSDPKTPQWNQSMFPKVPIRTRCGNGNGSSSCRANICIAVTNGSSSIFGERCNASHAFVCAVDSDIKCRNCHKYLVILAVVSGLILFTTFAIILWLLVYKRSKKRRKSRKVSNPASLSSVVPPSWKIFTSEELRSMTKNFSEANRLAGDAKTGGTYSGGLSDGTKVAVKRLKRSSFQRKKEFYSEIRRAAKLHHPNVVAIKGCCYDHGERFIVYEFIASGPLDRWLHHVPRGGRSLDWNMRLNIATTLAQGIAFLHDKVKPQVVHRDIRASNVLLDEEFGAHLMGVGLSKFVPWEVMQERTVMAGGTYGYLAPEYVYRNELTTKSDVYSFGVLLLEIVSGRRPTQAVNSSVGWQSIFEWATPLVQANRWLEILDPVITCECAINASKDVTCGSSASAIGPTFREIGNKMFLRCFKPKFYKKSKSTTSYMKIRIDIVRRKRIAMVRNYKTDIVNFLKNGQDSEAYRRAELLLEELRILSCYDLIERFCDCISENLSLMLKKRECPEECREAVSSLIYATAWVPDVPELKDLRAVFTKRFGNFIASSVNHELVEKTELLRPPSRELKIQTVKDVANEFSINWDPTPLKLMLLRETSALQIKDKVETRADYLNKDTEKSFMDEHSDDESVLSESWRIDSLSKGSLSSSSSSSSSSLRRVSVRKKKGKKILPYGIISSPDTKLGAGNDEKAQEEKEEKRKIADQENSRLLGIEGSRSLTSTSNNEVSTIRENERMSLFQRPNLLDYDDVVARLAALRRR